MSRATETPPRSNGEDPEAALWSQNGAISELEEGTPRPNGHRSSDRGGSCVIRDFVAADLIAPAGPSGRALIDITQRGAARADVAPLATAV